MYLESENHTNADGKPDGGFVRSTGLDIGWQAGRVLNGKPNGAFVEDVIQAAILRLEYLQSMPFKCVENEMAINSLNLALEHLNSRTARRTKQGVANTYNSINEGTNDDN